MSTPRSICPRCARNVTAALDRGESRCPHCAAPISRETCPVSNPPSVMRGLGLAVGDLWSVVKSGKTKPPTKRIVRQQTSEEQRDTEQGKVTLRRTVIEEIEIRPERPEDQP